MWKKWAIDTIVYLVIVMALYGIYSAVLDQDISQNQMEIYN